MEHGYGYRLRCGRCAVYGASGYGRYAGLKRYRLHGRHAAFCWLYRRGYISRSRRFVLRRDQFRAPDGVVQKVLAKDNISVRYQTSIVELSGEAMPTKITFKDNVTGETYVESFDPGSFGIFVFAGTQPHTELVDHLVNLAPDGGIMTDESMATRTPGLFAAGDIRSKRLRQVVTAVSDGAIAATSAYAFLRG